MPPDYNRRATGNSKPDMKIGYFLSCEEWGPHDLVAQPVKISPNQGAFFAAYRDSVLPRV